VAADKAEPVALADWLGEWHHNDGADDGDITVKAAKAGVLRIEGRTTHGGNDPGRVERGDIVTAGIEADATPAGDRLSFTGDNDCKVWMQHLGWWLVVNDDSLCGGDGATFYGFYTRQPRRHSEAAPQQSYPSLADWRAVGGDGPRW
jgi:hypothetical protein